MLQKPCRSNNMLTLLSICEGNLRMLPFDSKDNHLASISLSILSINSVIGRHCTVMRVRQGWQGRSILKIYSLVTPTTELTLYLIHYCSFCVFESGARSKFKWWFWKWFQSHLWDLVWYYNIMLFGAFLRLLGMWCDFLWPILFLVPNRSFVNISVPITNTFVQIRIIKCSNMNTIMCSMVQER